MLLAVLVSLAGAGFGVAVLGCAPTETGPGAADQPRMSYALAIHGGAVSDVDAITEERAALYEAALEDALSVGEKILAEGGDSLDAVEAVVRQMEDDPLFNAGQGAVYTHDGRHTLDASIMDGRDLSCGAVAGVSRVRNPIRLARMVMLRSPHVLMSGDGAEAFARELGFALVEPDYFDTERRREQWQSWKREQEESEPAEGSHGTVGAVALDASGHLAAATSTGGLTGKRYGRIGDSPIVGAGTYADDRSCAVSCTGQGEEFIRHGVAAEVSALMRHRGLGVQEAAQRVIHEVLAPGAGGLIAVSQSGEIALAFSTGGMLRGAADSSGRRDVSLR
jgi:beta-aspartyl-peptidase (threonine type)